MKKMLFAVLVLTFTSSLCFAQEAQAPATTSVSVGTKTFTGKVCSVAIGDATLEAKSEFGIVDDNGQTIGFAVEKGTPVTDKAGKAATLSGIKNDIKVTVEYTIEANGTNKAQSIKFVE